MNCCFSINSITLEKFLKRYKLTSRGKQQIIKAALKRASTRSGLNRIDRKFESKESIKNKNKHL